jgi:hypothetical protein
MAGGENKPEGRGQRCYNTATPYCGEDQNLIKGPAHCNNIQRRIHTVALTEQYFHCPCHLTATTIFNELLADRSGRGV